MKKILISLTIFALAIPALAAVKAKNNSTTISAAPKLITAEASARFRDLSTKDAAYSYVMQMVVSYEALSGYPDGTFKGNKTITRAEFSKIMTSSLAYLEKKFDLPLADEPATPEVKFKDLGAKNWAYPFVAKLVTKYKIISGYPDGTFRPNQTISRYELATVLAKTSRMIDDRCAIPPSTVKLTSLKDVKSTHWAMKDIQFLLNLGIMEAAKEKKKVVFKGENKVNRFDVAVSGAKLIGVSENAIAALPQEKLEALRGKNKPPVVPSSQVARAAETTSQPQASLTLGWGNIYENSSGTNNWMGFNGAASYGNIFKIWRFSGNYEVTGRYGFNQVVYIVPFGGGVTGGVVNENRYDLEFNTIYPIVRFMGVTGKLLVGAKYINLNNPTAPTNFTGINLGVVTSVNLCGRNLLARAFYSYPTSRASVTPSIFGQPTQLFDYEAAIDANLFKLPVLIGFAGETMTLSGGPARYYNNFFIRYFLF